MWHWRTVGHVKIAILPPKPEVQNYEIRLLKFQRQICGFDHAELEETDTGRLRQRPTTGNGNVLGANLAILGHSSLSQSLGCTLVDSSWSKITSLPLEFWWCLSYFRRYKYFRFDRHIAISGCRSSSKLVSLRSPWSISPGLYSWKDTDLTFFSEKVWGLFYPQRTRCA